VTVSGRRTEQRPRRALVAPPGSPASPPGPSPAEDAPRRLTISVFPGFRSRRRPVVAETAEAHDRRVRRRVGIVWSLLLLNALTFFPGGLLIPIPNIVGKAVTQGALLLAVLLALTLNRRLVVRPNVFLCLISLLVAEAAITSLHPQFFGTVYRTFRLAEFVTALWLLSPWWGRRDLLLVRSHLTAISVALGTVVVGLLIAPGHALAQGGRLAGVVWPIPPPQVAHYSAFVIGVTAVLWLCGMVRGRTALLTVTVAGAVLLLTHTRTALLAMVAGILVAGLSLFTARARVRKLFAGAGVVLSLGAITLSTVVTTWLVRGQSGQSLTELTGRTKVWTALLSFPRNNFQEIFGFGLSNSSFNGLPIDSNWLSSYQEQGIFGVIVCAAVLLFLLVAAYFQPRGVQRAIALFLITYSLVASFTETGFTDVSTYLLELTLAASLMAPSIAGRRSK
jgi:hypothetical protein